jgi:hypothetical protein
MRQLLHPRGPKTPLLQCAGRSEIRRIWDVSLGDVYAHWFILVRREKI